MPDESAPVHASPPRRPLLPRVLADWERSVAISIGGITLCAALLTYLAVRQDDAAAGARGQAAVETLQIERQHQVAAIRVQGETAAADRYRRALAEVESLRSQAATASTAGNRARAARLRADALVIQYLADAYRGTTFDSSQLTGTTAASTYDTEGRLATIEGYEAVEAIPSDQPAATARIAEQRHQQSVRTMVAVVLLLLLVLVLTVGRIVRERWRPVVLLVGTTGFLVAVIGAGINAAVGS